MDVRPWPIRAASQDLSKADSFVIGPLTVDPPTRRIGNGVRDEQLEPRVMRVLVALAAAQGKVLSRDDLIELCWDGQIVGDNAINRVISRLRATLADLADDTAQIETITKVGFRLVAVAPRSSATSASPATAPAPMAVAVLAFDNLSDDPSYGYLADGLAEELITNLSRTPKLNVSARTSSFAYRGRQADVREIGRELGVGRLIEGSVRVSGSRLRATIQLIDAVTGFHLWAGNFDREMTELFAVQDDIAASIAEALETELGSIDPPSRDLQALHLYMQANAIRDRGRPEDIIEAVSLYRQAIARDPAFGRALSQLAFTLMAGSNNGVLPLSARIEARTTAEQAISCDPALAMARMVFAGLDGLTGWWLEADENFRTSLLLAPREPNIHTMWNWYVLAPCGHLQRAQDSVDRAFELGPAMPIHSLGRVMTAGLRGDGSLIMQNLQMATTLGLSPDEPSIRSIRAALAFHRTDWEEAVEHITVSFPPELRKLGSETASLFYRARLGMVEKSTASAAIERLTAASDTDDLFTRYQLVIGTMMEWQAGLGEFDAAFRVADLILAAWRRTGQLATMGLLQMWFPSMRAFRQDPRFSGFVEQLGMFAYWRRHGPPDGHELRDGRLVCL